MRIAIWAYTAAVALISVMMRQAAGIFENIHHYRLLDEPLPNITWLFLDVAHWQFPCLPLLVALAALWLSRPGAISVNRAFIFAGISTLVIAFLIEFTWFGLSCPFVIIRD